MIFDIPKSENTTVEFKREYSDKIVKTVSAFANNNGGTFYIGVDDDGNKCPSEEPDKLSLRIINQIKDLLEPDITCFLKSEIDDDKIIKITVSEGSIKPYGNKENKKIYTRIGTSTIAASPMEIRNMVLNDFDKGKKSDGFVKQRMELLKKQSLNNAKLLIHIIPKSSFDGTVIDLTQFENWDFGYRSIHNRISFQFDRDGAYIERDHARTNAKNHLKIWSNGIIEILDMHFLACTQYKEANFNWQYLLQLVFKTIQDSGSMLEKLNIPKPWYVNISLIDINGKVIFFNIFDSCKFSEHEQDFCATKSIWYDSNKSLAEEMALTFNSLANLVGKPSIKYSEYQGSAFLPLIL